MDITPILAEIRKQELSPRSALRLILTDDTRYVEMAEVVLNSVAMAVYNKAPLTASCRSVATKLLDLMEVETDDITDYSILSIGISAHHWMAKADYIDIEKHIVDDGRSKAMEQYFITSLSKEFTDYATSISPSSEMPSVVDGFTEWRRPMMWKGERRIPIVKKAKNYGILDHYTVETMPDVYNALNRLGKQEFKVNRSILSLTEETQGRTFGFIPTEVSEEARKGALRGINDITRKSKFLNEIRFKEMNKWLLDEAELPEEIAQNISKKRASEKAQDYYDEKVEPFTEVISEWSKRLDYKRTLRLGKEWMEETINYIFQMDTRGRIYAVQNYLTPLGSDFAKSLLLFNEKHQVSGFDLCIHIANCFGNDKLSFEGRVEWVNENGASLYAIGEDPIANYHLIIHLGLDGEQKTKWQGVAACQVYKDYCDYVDMYGDDTGFETDLIIGLDSTASGTQILTMLGRDDRVAPFVNVSKTDGAVGDFYTYLAKYLQPKLEEHRGESETLDAILNNYNKYARKLAKRNSMTFSYSGTKFGFGQQHWQDRKSYGPLGEVLTRPDCRIIGNEMYDVCVENIRGGAEIMQWLRDGCDYHTDGAMISWTLPDGFKAFQVCDKSKKSKIEGKIGTRSINLVYYTFQDKPKVSEHKNGISPNFVHSLDAYLLRLIVNGMPLEAPISTVHDQFSTTSCYIETLQMVAKEAYRQVADRDEAERMATEAFGKQRELPMVGDWTIDNIEEADFIVC